MASQTSSRRNRGPGGCAVVACVLWIGLAEACAKGTPPPGEKDLVVFVAKGQPVLFRLFRRQAIPFGPARFNDPAGLVADPDKSCFWVLDQPVPMVDGNTRLWRIDANGKAMIAGTFTSANNPPTIGLDARGRVLITGRQEGVARWDGRRLVGILPQSNDRRGVACATANPRGGLLVASRGDPVPRRPDPGHQGAIWAVDDSRQPATARAIVLNRRAGRTMEQTLWRQPCQLLADSAGRVLLVDRGSTATPPEGTAGGIFCLHPNQRLEELTYKTPTGRSGPLRRPGGIAEWATDTYIVADPFLYLGPGGSGGLVLLGLDGRRGTAWRMGERIRPIGVAVLRTGAAAPPGAPRSLTAYQGMHTALPVGSGVRAAEWLKAEATGMTVAGRRIVTGQKMVRQSAQAAAAQAATLMTGAAWSIGPAGTIHICPRGKNPQTLDPRVWRGTAMMVHDTVIFHATNDKRRRSDPAASIVKGTLTPLADGRLWAHVWLLLQGPDKGTLNAEIDQVIQPAGRLAAGAPAPLAPAALAGRYAAVTNGKARFAKYTREELRGRPGSPTYGLYSERKVLPSAQGAAMALRIFGSGLWQIDATGLIQVRCPYGTLRGYLATMGSEVPFRLTGKAAGQLWCRLSGRIELVAAGKLRVYAAVSYGRNKEELAAEFDLGLTRQ